LTEANPRETTVDSKNPEFRIIEYSKNQDSIVTNNLRGREYVHPNMLIQHSMSIFRTLYLKTVKKYIICGWPSNAIEPAYLLCFLLEGPPCPPYPALAFSLAAADGPTYVHVGFKVRPIQNSHVPKM